MLLYLSSLLTFIVAVILIAIILAGYLYAQKKNKELNQQLQNVQLEKKNLLSDIEKGVLSKEFLQDKLTNLISWELFENRLAHKIKEALRYQLTLAVLYIDIKNFYIINTALNYKIGDKLIQQIAQRLESNIRKADSITRYSRETFVVLLAHLGKPEIAGLISNRILKILHEPFNVDEQEIYLQPYIGISIYPLDGQESAILLRSADNALHAAQKNSKPCFQFYEEFVHVQSKKTLIFQNSLNKDSIFKDLKIIFQPIYNNAKGQVFALEASLNLNNETLGRIDAHELMMQIEKQGKSEIFNHWLYEHACEQLMKWRGINFATNLCLPIATLDITSSHFIYQLSEILYRYHLEGSSIILALTIDHRISLSAFEKTLNMLKHLNVKILADRFGGIEGFVLSDLKLYPIDYVRLDPELLKDIGTNNKTKILTKNFLEMTKALEIELIVPSVDDAEQKNNLVKLGCNLLQGKYFNLIFNKENEKVNLEI